jgi:alkanesulfonate monooxygenase SsuD/methylene tetrahydromethanopterin reductase-like flavin-dependent oxidoreductase (luciferase family)
MGPLYPRMLGERFGMRAAAEAMAGARELPAVAEELAEEVTLMATYDRADDAIGAWFAAGADNVSLVLPPGRPEAELTEILEVAADAMSGARAA